MPSASVTRSTRRHGLALRRSLARSRADHYRQCMRISDVVKRKGDTVITVRSDASVTALLDLLAELTPAQPVSSIMTREVQTCSPEDELGALEHTMTENRFRHVPVVVDGQLRAIVSIGDVVKHRMTDLQAERDQLSAYIQQ